MGKMSREAFDDAINTAKSGLKLDESGNMSSRIRGLGPGMAARALEGEGVDVKQLIARKGQGNLGSAEEEPLEDRDDQTRLKSSGFEKKEKASFAKGGKVSSASKRADGIAKRGKTRGKMC